MYSGISMSLTERNNQIRSVAHINIDLAFLLAEFNFEWILRRTIIFMSSCPSKLMRQYLSRNNGWDGFERAWKECEMKGGMHVKETFRDAVCYGNSRSHHYVYAELRRALDNRHRLVHGERCSIKTEDALIGIKVFMDVAESLVNLARDKGVNIFERISGVRKCKCNDRDGCPIAITNGRANHTRLCTVTKGGRRIYDSQEISKELELD